MPEAEPAVVTLEPVTTAVIRRVVPMDRLPEFFDGSFGALAAAVQEQDAGVAGPAFAFYHRLPTDTADLEVGFPTLRAVDGDRRCARRIAARRTRRPGGARRLVRRARSGVGAAARLDRRAGPAARGRPSGRSTSPSRRRTWIRRSCGPS